MITAQSSNTNTSSQTQCLFYKISSIDFLIFLSQGALHCYNIKSCESIHQLHSALFVSPCLVPSPCQLRFVSGGLCEPVTAWHFAPSNADAAFWQEITIASLSTGRHICLEATRRVLFGRQNNTRDALIPPHPNLSPFCPSPTVNR